MALPEDLLQAVSSPGGGRIALILGAGCSVEFPTCVPPSRQCSLEVHRRLVADGVLQNGDCSDPDDLSIVADAVFAKKNSQRDVVDRLREQFDLKLATPNDGYLIAAAMLCEGAIASVVTLNFDLALSTALSVLGVQQIVGVIERPEDLQKEQRAINVYYLHRNANAADPESWVLRTASLEEDWRHHWEDIIATKVLAAPVVVLAGLGTPVLVLIESAKRLRRALPGATKLYQVDLVDKADSRFFREMALDPADYIQCGWCQFMDQLSDRLLIEHIAEIERAVGRKVRDDHLTDENVRDLLNSLQALGLVSSGKIRAQWLLHDKPYCPSEPHAGALMADLLLALAMMARLSGAVAVIFADGVVEFQRDGRAVVAYIVASGRGHRGKSAVEAAVEARSRQYRGRPVPLSGVIVGGTSDAWTTPVTAPTDVVRGDVSNEIGAGLTALPLLHINELREYPNRIQQVVP